MSLFHSMSLIYIPTPCSTQQVHNVKTISGCHRYNSTIPVCIDNRLWLLSWLSAGTCFDNFTLLTCTVDDQDCQAELFLSPGNKTGNNVTTSFNHVRNDEINGERRVSLIRLASQRQHTRLPIFNSSRILLICFAAHTVKCHLS